MKKYWLLGLAVIIAIYLNQAYAHVYNNRVALSPLDPSPTVVTTPTTIENGGAGLVYTAFGDSLTAGTGATTGTASYPYQVGLKLSTDDFPVTIVNTAVPGATAADVLNQQIPSIDGLFGDVITVSIGVNDVHARTPLPEFKETVQKILTSLNESSADVYITTIPYLGNKQLFLPPYRWYFDWQTQRYNQIIKTVAEEIGVSVIDLYTLSHTTAWTGDNYYAADGFHLSDTGYSLWSSWIYDALNH